MTGEEKFAVDLEGYLVIKNVLTNDEVAEMNAIIDKGDLHGPPSLWGEPFRKLIDHPKILPYLTDLLGPHVRLDHDYALFMEKGQGRGGLHGGEDGGRAGGSVGDHWYKYRDGHMRNGLSVMTYNLVDAPAGAGGFACIPASHKCNLLTELPTDVRRFERPAHYVVQPPLEAGDVLFFTEALIHGTMPWTAEHQRRSLLYKYSPGHSAWSEHYYDISKYEGLTEQQKRMLLPPSVGRRPRVIEEN